MVNQFEIVATVKKNESWYSEELREGQKGKKNKQNIEMECQLQG